MGSKLQIELPRARIADFCRRWQVTEFALFGSVLRADFRPESDVDVMVTFAPGTDPTLFELMDMRRELEGIFGRPVDLVERRDIEQSPNYIRRKHILNSAEVVHGA
jgi:uncharacterized protein